MFVAISTNVVIYEVRSISSKIHKPESNSCRIWQGCRNVEFQITIIHDRINLVEIRSAFPISDSGVYFGFVFNSESLQWLLVHITETVCSITSIECF